MHAGKEAPTETAAEASASWPDDIFEILQCFDVRQVPYVPDAGHSQLIERVLGERSMRAVPLTTRGEWGEFNPWQVPMGSTTAGVFELSGIKVLRASHAGEVRDVVEAAAGQAYKACTPTAVLLSQRLIGAKVLVK